MPVWFVKSALSQQQPSLGSLRARRWWTTRGWRAAALPWSESPGCTRTGPSPPSTSSGQKVRSGVPLTKLWTAIYWKIWPRAIFNPFYQIKSLTFAESEGGKYKCIAENSAGRVETNFTLNIGHFSSPGELNSGEIIGVSITVILLVMVFLVIIAVLVLKVSVARKT